MRFLLLLAVAAVVGAQCTNGTLANGTACSLSPSVDPSPCPSPCPLPLPCPSPSTSPCASESPSNAPFAPYPRDVPRTVLAIAGGSLYGLTLSGGGASRLELLPSPGVVRSMAFVLTDYKRVFFPISRGIRYFLLPTARNDPDVPAFGNYSNTDMDFVINAVTAFPSSFYWVGESSNIIRRVRLNQADEPFATDASVDNILTLLAGGPSILALSPSALSFLALRTVNYDLMLVQNQPFGNIILQWQPDNVTMPLVLVPDSVGLYPCLSYHAQTQSNQICQGTGVYSLFYSSTLGAFSEPSLLYTAPSGAVPTAVFIDDQRSTWAVLIGVRNATHGWVDMVAVSPATDGRTLMPIGSVPIATVIGPTRDFTYSALASIPCIGGSSSVVYSVSPPPSPSALPVLPFPECFAFFSSSLTTPSPSCLSGCKRNSPKPTYYWVIAVVLPPGLVLAYLSVYMIIACRKEIKKKSVDSASECCEVMYNGCARFLSCGLCAACCMRMADSVSESAGWFEHKREKYKENRVELAVQVQAPSGAFAEGNTNY